MNPEVEALTKKRNKDNEQLAADFLDICWNGGDLDHARACAGSGFYYKTTFNENILNIDQYIEFVETFRKAMPELVLVVEETMSQDDRVMTHVSFSGSVDKPFFGIPPTNKIITFPAISLWDVSDGKIHSLNTLIDMSGIERQLGVNISPKQSLGPT